MNSKIKNIFKEKLSHWHDFLFNFVALIIKIY
jgi:hypothetical protein